MIFTSSIRPLVSGRKARKWFFNALVLILMKAKRLCVFQINIIEIKKKLGESLWNKCLSFSTRIEQIC